MWTSDIETTVANDIEEHKVFFGKMCRSLYLYTIKLDQIYEPKDVQVFDRMFQQCMCSFCKSVIDDFHRVAYGLKMVAFKDGHSKMSPKKEEKKRKLLFSDKFLW